MSSRNGKLPAEERMERLERRAEVVRSRLFRALDTLEARRHRVQEVTHDAKRLAKPTAASMIAVVTLVGVGLFALKLRSRRNRSVLARVAHAIGELGVVPRPPSLTRRAVEGCVVSLLGFGVTELAKRALEAKPARL